MTLAIGDRVADVQLVRPDGTPVRLSEIAASAVVLVFLRHLA